MWLLAIAVIFSYVIYKSFILPSFYWQKRNVFHVRPFTRFFKVFFGSKSFAESVQDTYNEFPNRRYFGSYQFLQPSIFVRDLELVKKITVKDFDHFVDHMGFTNEKTDVIMGQNLFSLKGNKWRDMRATLSPAFTSSKMRAMFELILETAENYTNHFLKEDSSIIELEMKDLFSKFTTDVIATCAFGIKCNSLENVDNDFFKMGQSISTVNPLGIIWALLHSVFPGFFQFFKIPVFPRKVTNFFRQIVTDTISMREKNSTIRPDMIHLLMEARKGRLQHEQTNQTEKEGFATVEESSIGRTASNKLPITDDLITAQAVVFFLAGFDTSSTLISFVTHELAVNPDIQKKVQEEIDDTLRNNSLTYDAIQKMKYLDQIVSETLRKYPPGYVLNRICVKDYQIPAENDLEKSVTVEKGCLVAIPVYAIHNDPKYFPNPEVFDPDRFSEENNSKIVPGSYMPFGSGPRNCIGSRFALLECKAVIASVLSKFDLMPVKRTVIPLRLNKAFALGVKDGFWLGIKKRNIALK